MRLQVLWLLVLASALRCEAQEIAPSPERSATAAAPKTHVVLTNVAQLRALPAVDYLGECRFRLEGVITLVDTNRDLTILQDATGAVALNFKMREPLEVGQAVCLEGTNCHPYAFSLPDYPYRPAGWDIRPSFEAPSEFGDYYLTRMRGCLHPPVTGEYTFWIASDNSSELWLSANDDPTAIKKVAFISRFGWVGQHEWSRFPSQRSDPILLKAGRSYYIEALQEQTTEANHLSVAWAGPTLEQSVISAPYVTPWRQTPAQTETYGILREYWTNYSAGNLTILSGPRPFESALTVETLKVSTRGRGEMPKPVPISLNLGLSAQDNYRWAEVEGRVKFTGKDGNVAFLELSDGQAELQVRALHWTQDLSHEIANAPVRIEGVCEWSHDENGNPMAGMLWASAEDSISLLESDQPNSAPKAIEQPAVVPQNSANKAMAGFFTTHGVVTFNDRVLDKDYLFVQEDKASLLVSLKDRHFKNQLKVGQWVELGGALQPDKPNPVISPLVVTELGWHPMPAPILEPIRIPVPENREGRWTEVEGVVHALNPDGTISLMGRAGPVHLWVGQARSGDLSRYVDSKVRVRGVLSLTTPESPLLLVPSRAFVAVEEEAPEDPFRIPVRAIADLLPDVPDPALLHRTRLVGEVTCVGAQSFFIQDSSGGVRVEARAPSQARIGQSVEVIGFPMTSGPFRILTDALVRPAEASPPARPKALDLNEMWTLKQNGTLVRVNATLISQKVTGDDQVLEVQEQQRIFAARLSTAQGNLPPLAPGSRLGITGVCDNETSPVLMNGTISSAATPLGSLNLWLRSPADVMVLSGPPWWTLRRVVMLVGALLTVLAVTLLWVHLLRRRLGRQQATQRAFSQQMLQRLEGERQRIAANLHDSLGQLLLAIKNQAILAMQRGSDEPGLRQRLDEISATTSQAIEEVRQITHGLRPYQLDRLGLTQAIRAIVSRASANGHPLIASRVEDIDSVFDKDCEIHIYRIVQEAVTNVVKHSAATEAAVVVKKRAGVVSLSVRDNGRGFESGAATSSQPLDLGYGLSGIAERVRILGGNLAIDSRPGEGTSLAVEIPLAMSTNETGSNHTDR